MTSMTEEIKLYKRISLEIVELLKQEKFDEVNLLLDKRQELIDRVYEVSIFKKSLINENIIEIDSTIKIILEKSIMKVKDEIKEHRKSQNVNDSYIYLNREKLNIFNKKV